MPQTVTVSPTEVTLGEEITHDASNSTGDIDTYTWAVGDRELTGVETTTSFEQVGTYEVLLTVSGADGETDSASTTVTVEEGKDTPDWDEHPVMGYAGSGNVNNEKVTHDIRTFASVSNDGTINPPWGLSPEPNSKVILSIGGWNNSDGFPQTAEDQESCERFASQCVEIMRENNIDGVDLDWEFPGDFGPDGLYSPPDDVQNFTKLVAECRRQFDEAAAKDDTEYLLTAALNGTIEMLEPLEHDELSEQFDYAKMMTYDYNSPVFVDNTNHNSPLYTNPNVPDGRDGSIHKSLTYMLDQGWDSSQVVMGLAFYGRVFQAASGSGTPMSFNEIDDLVGQGWTDHERYWDDEAKVPYLFDGEELISYDDAESIATKAEYARENGHPIMFWAAGHDPDEVLLDTVNDALGT